MIHRAGSRPRSNAEERASRLGPGPPHNIQSLTVLVPSTWPVCAETPRPARCVPCRWRGTWQSPRATRAPAQLPPYQPSPETCRIHLSSLQAGQYPSSRPLDERRPHLTASELHIQPGCATSQDAGPAGIPHASRTAQCPASSLGSFQKPAARAGGQMPRVIPWLQLGYLYRVPGANAVRHCSMPVPAAKATRCDLALPPSVWDPILPPRAQLHVLHCALWPPGGVCTRGAHACTRAFFRDAHLCCIARCHGACSAKHGVDNSAAAAGATCLVLRTTAATSSRSTHHKCQQSLDLFDLNGSSAVTTTGRAAPHQPSKCAACRLPVRHAA